MKIDYSNIFGKPADEIGSIIKDLQMFFDKDIIGANPTPPVPPTPSKPANNEIWYTGEYYDMQAGIDFISDNWGEPYKGPAILSNKLVGDHYVITFDSDITAVGSKEDTSGDGSWYLYPMFVTDDYNDVPIITCNVTSVVLPDTVTYMEYGFYECDELEVVTLPENLNCLDYSSFYDCDLLEDLIYQGTKKQWFDIEKNSNWNEGTPITTIHCTDGDIVLGNPVYVMIDDKNYQLYNNMTYAEQGYEDLYIQNTYPSGGSSEDYRYDTSNYPQEGDNLYTSCVEEPVSVILTLSDGTSISIVNKKHIDEASIVNYRYSLVSAEIHEYVEEIGYGAFRGCSYMSSVTIPHSVYYIGEHAFQGCSSLTSINIPSRITSISNGTFTNCTSLALVTIPNSVTYIGDSAFQGCSNLTSVTCESATPPTLNGSSVFDNTNNCPIYVPNESVDAYKAAEYWSEYTDRIQPMFQ